MRKKKTMWFELGENEQVEDCLNRMKSEGYAVTGKKEEPLFVEKDGGFIPIRQLIKFKGVLFEK